MQHRTVDPGRGRPAPSGRRVAGHLVELGAARRGDGRGERRPTQRRLLRQIQRPRRLAARQHHRPFGTGARRGAIHPAARDCRPGTLLGTGSFGVPPGQRTGHVLARAGRQPAPVAPRGPARHGRQHPALLCRRGTTPHGTPGRVGRRLLRRIQHGGRARLRRPHATAPQRQTGDRRGKHPDDRFRHPAIPGNRPGRRRGTDRHGAARHGLRTPGRENRPGNLLRRTLRRFLRRFRAPRGTVHGHHLQRRLVGRHARLQTPLHDLAPARHRTPPCHRPVGQHRHVGLHRPAAT